MRGPVARADTTSRIFAAAGRCGMPAEVVLERTGICDPCLIRTLREHAQLLDAERPPYLPMTPVFALWDTVMRELDQCKLLRFSSTTMPFSRLGTLGLLCLSAPTRGQAAQCALRMFRLITTSGYWEIRSGTRAFDVVWHRKARSLGQCMANEALLAQSFNTLNEVCDTPARVLSVNLAHARLSTRSVLEETFDAAVRYDAGEYSIRVSRDSMAEHTRYRAAPEVFEYFLRECTSQMERRGSAVVEDTASCVRQCLQEGELQARSVARRLGMSPRTLERRLSVHGTSYSDIRELVLKQVAKELVLSGAPIKHVADRCGYADTSAFSRAFRRWYGVYPSQLRSVERDVG